MHKYNVNLNVKKKEKTCKEENPNQLTACKAEYVRKVWGGTQKKSPWVKRM